MTRSVLVKTVKFIVVDIVLDILFFPIWWYTIGLRDRVAIAWGNIKRREREQALVLWLKNFFKPMYGQTDWQGRFISFIFRVLLLFWKGAIMSFWVVLNVLVVFVWICLPPITLYNIFTNIVYF